MLGDAPVAAAEMLAFLMRVHRRDEFEFEGEAGLIRLQRKAVTAQAFEDLDFQRPDRRVERVGPQAPRDAEIILLALEHDAGEAVHHVAIGMPAEADVEDEVSAGDGMAGVPEALHPGGIGAEHMIERGRQLMADEIVLLGQHGFPSSVFSAPPDISMNAAAAPAESGPGGRRAPH